MDKKRKFMIFWLGQAVSQLGSSMTAFALTIWAFEKTHAAMMVSLLSFCNWLPYILVSIFAGSFIDRYSKKRILRVADTIAAFCTISVLISIYRGDLGIGHIYMVNVIVGFMNAFQSPASSVVTGLLIPDGQYDKASGLQSFSSNLVMVAAPVLSGVFMAFAGLQMVLMMDLLSFLFAMISLCFIEILESPDCSHKKENRNQTSALREAIDFLKKEKGIFYIMLSMAVINFFSRLTYENILAPMILARSAGNSAVYGLVNGVMGVGGIVGGILVASGKKKRDLIKIIYFSAGISFLFGDLLMGIGRNPFTWCMAGLAASLPIPFVMAGQNILLYQRVPRKMQGRIFAIRNGVQYSTIPVGILLGGYLADFVFEPFMASNQWIACLLQSVVGNGAGSGMAVMFLCTGFLGTIFSCMGYKNRYIQSLRTIQER